MTNPSKPVEEIEAYLVDIPDDLAVARYSNVDLRVDPSLLLYLARFKRIMTEKYGGRSSGHLVVNSCYRRKGTTCEKDYGGKVDLTDSNGHWTGRSIDFTTTQTVAAFYPVGKRQKWRRDLVRFALHEAGFNFPWYWKRGKVGGEVHEYWHVGFEVPAWTQKNAFRGCPPPWYL